jgi:hypothetical protein
MSGLHSRIRRLEQRFGPDPDDPLGLRALSDDELALFLRITKAAAAEDWAQADALAAQMDPEMGRKFCAMAQRAEALAEISQMSLKARLARLEAGLENLNHCELCALILQAAGGMTAAEAAALARHPAHSLEELATASEAKRRHRPPPLRP